MGPALFDYNMQLIQLSVIQLSGGHCIRKNNTGFQMLLYDTLFHIIEQCKFYEDHLCEVYFCLWEIDLMLSTYFLPNKHILYIHGLDSIFVLCTI